MWVVGLRRSLARSAEVSTNLVCRRVLPTVKLGHSFAVSRAFSGTALNMQENDAAAAAAAETKTQSEATEDIPHPKARHPALMKAMEKEKRANEILHREKVNAKIEVKKLKEEKQKLEKVEEKVEKKTKEAEENAKKVEKKVKKVEEQIKKIKKRLTPEEKEAKRAALQEEIRAIRKAKAIEVKTYLRERHAKAVAKAQARRERAAQRIAKQMERVAKAKKERQDLTKELSRKSLKFPERKPKAAFHNFMAINIPPKDEKNPASFAAWKQIFTETVAKWYALTEEEQAKYTIDDYDAKLEDWKKKKAAWKASLTTRQRGLLRRPRLRGTYGPFTLFAKENIVSGTRVSAQMKGLAEKYRALTDAEKEDYRIRAAELTDKVKAAAAAENDASA